MQTRSGELQDGRGQCYKRLGCTNKVHVPTDCQGVCIATIHSCAPRETQLQRSTV